MLSAEPRLSNSICAAGRSSPLRMAMSRKPRWRERLFKTRSSTQPVSPGTLSPDSVQKPKEGHHRASVPKLPTVGQRTFKHVGKPQKTKRPNGDGQHDNGQLIGNINAACPSFAVVWV